MIFYSTPILIQLSCSACSAALFITSALLLSWRYWWNWLASSINKSRALEIDLPLHDYRNHRTPRAICYKESIKKDIIKKQYISQIVLTEERTIAKPHAYLSSTKHEYHTCFLCKVRKSMVCIKCGSCLLCHPFIEKIETRKPVFYAGIAMLLDIESPALSEIKRWTHYLLCLNCLRTKVGGLISDIKKIMLEMLALMYYSYSF